ncbi:hypothetical protein CL614_04260 [archaeon]|nr:hypothetical protein [archaeon]
MKFFPFSNIRAGQSEFISDVAHTIKNKKHLIADAPAGIGKTAAVLSAALEYVIEHPGKKKIFFVAPRHSQHKMAIDTVNLIREKTGKDIKAVDIIGKQWLCNQEHVDLLGSTDFPDYCKNMRKDQKCKYYNMTKLGSKFTPQAHAKVYELIEKGPMHAEELKSCSGNFCAFEMACRLAEKADIIVGDYYHAFSSARDSVMEKANIALDDIILIVDEAHNLPNRILKLMSKRMTSSVLNYALKESSKYAPELEEEVQNISDILNSIYRTEEKERFVDKEELVDSITDYDQLVVDLQAIGEEVRDEQKKSFLGSIGLFLDSWRKDFEGFTRIVSEDFNRRGRSLISLSYDCLDPSIISKDIIDTVHSCICMSGTLKPMEMYRDLLGFDISRTVMKEYASSFPIENRLDLLIPDVTTKYENRTPEEYEKFGRYITKCLDSCKGNASVFFPSYQMRDDIMRFVETDKTLFVETNLMNKKEKSEFYHNFVNDKNAVLMGCQAGSFAEGVDFPGMQLTTVIIVGIALERLTLKVKALIDYYDTKFGKGWEYAYSFPAVQRAVQSSGRCIRSETDRGASIFMDKRFSWLNYRKIFPNTIKFVTTVDPSRELKEFFLD